MNIEFGRGTTECGPGIQINLDADEVAIAIHAWLVAHGVYVSGPRTVRVNEELIECGEIYVDPSGSVIYEGRRFTGHGQVEL